ncbi:MAG TPA: carboxypeptidase-like regulatory domain-containing protein [Planctomycetota bacterium]|nr:carboxypeptidase-like regulatory domain-containing protein [Planctomycetota bacterium]
MRRLVLILLGGLAFGEDAPAPADPSLHEVRAWKGVIEARGRNVGKEITRGEEVQHERIEFLLVTEPPRKTIAWPRLPFRMREGKGAFGLSADVSEGEGAGAITSQGATEGDLHPAVEGYVEPTTGKYSLTVNVAPATIAVVGSVTAVVDGKLVHYRTAGQRAAFHSGFGMEGDVGEEGRVIRGSRTITDRRGGVTREAEVTWRIERLDPAVRGTVRDHLGRPIEGLRVLARHRRPGLPLLVREATTDADGRFRIEAYQAGWMLQVFGEERDGRVIAGIALPDLVQVRFDDVPELEIKTQIYRLDRLPQARLLRGHFQGDADAFLEYTRARVPAAVLERALEEAEKSAAPAAGE